MVKNTYYLSDKLATSILVDIAVQLEQKAPNLGVSFLMGTSPDYRYHLLQKNNFNLNELNIQSPKGLFLIGEAKFTTYQLTQLPI